MIFYETAIFTIQITSLITDESYTEFQKVLIADPESGDLIRGGQGLRKIRWRLAGGGKSGGIRIIYYLVSGDEIFSYSPTRRVNRKTSPKIRQGFSAAWSINI